MDRQRIGHGIMQPEGGPFAAELLGHAADDAAQQLIEIRLAGQRIQCAGQRGGLPLRHGDRPFQVAGE